MGSSLATIGGYVLPAGGGVTWSFTAGTQPFSVSFDVPSFIGDKLEGLIGQRVTYSLGGDAPTTVVSDCWILSVDASAVPWLRRVTIADRRWRWPRRHVKRDYNCRIRTGDRRLITEGVSEQLAIAVDNFSFRKSTLKGGVALWKPSEILDDLIRYVDIDGEAPDLSKLRAGVTVQDLSLDDPGDGAINRALAFIPGATLYVTEDGKVKGGDATDQDGASAALSTAGAAAAGYGMAAVRKLQGIRPALVNVLFSIEQELCIKTRDEGYAINASDTSKYFENVLQVTDPSLTLASGRVVARGTWITVEEAFAAWGSPKVSAAISKRVANFQPGPLTHDIVQRAWWTLVPMYTQLGMPDPDADWVARITELVARYRRTYRISAYWRDRILSLRPYRVGILDTVTGFRAPALVVSDYAVFPTLHGQASQPDFNVYIANVHGYNDDLASARPATATVSVLDQDQKIIHIDWHGSAYGLFGEVIPCLVDNPPEMEPGVNKKTAKILGTVYEGAAPSRLHSGHKLAVVITAVPGSPNSNDQLHRVVVTPSDADGLGVRASPATGPEWDLRVVMTTARFMWSDAQESQIDKVFGRGVDTPGAKPTYPSDQLEAAGLLVDGDALSKVAKAAAAALYSVLVDHVAGTIATKGAENVRPVGSLVSARVDVAPNGAVLRIFEFGIESQRIDLFQLLDDATRQQLFRLIQPQT